MTVNEIFENEIKCIKRRSSGQCNGGTDCCTCDLLLNDKDIISAYVRAMQANETINRQKAEIEMLQGLANHHRNVIDYLNNGIAIAKAKAIKEFVMRFEKKIRDVKVTLGQTWEIQSALKEVEKEMVGDENG